MSTITMMDGRPVQFKDYQIAEFKAADDGSSFEGYASTWDLDLRGDVIKRGAFAKTLMDRGPRTLDGGGIRSDIKVLWQHNWDKPIGLPTQMAEDARGLFVRANLIDTMCAQDAMKLLKSGVVDKMSIGYTIINAATRYAEDDGDYEGRDINELKLYEFSPVTFPCNEAADITGVKSFQQLIDGLMERLSTPEWIICGDRALPIAPDVSMKWEAALAFKRVSEWAGEDLGRLRKAFVVYDRGAAGRLTSYKMQFADIVEVDGKKTLVAVPKALFGVAASLQGGRGGIAMSSTTSAMAKSFLTTYYVKMERTPPWSSGKAIVEAMGEEFLTQVKHELISQGNTLPEFITKVQEEGNYPKWLNHFLQALIEANEPPAGTPEAKNEPPQPQQDPSDGQSLLKQLQGFKLV